MSVCPLTIDRDTAAETEVALERQHALALLDESFPPEKAPSRVLDRACRAL